MKDKILFWIDNEWLRFCIAKAMQNLYDCDLYAVIDIRYTSKKFFQDQQIVKFLKTWFYRDYIVKTEQEPDLEYLKYFEEVRAMKVFQWAILTHVPVHVDQLNRFRFNIHGHLHDHTVSRYDAEGNEYHDHRYFNVSLERIAYTPIPVETVKGMLGA